MFSCEKIDSNGKSIKPIKSILSTGISWVWITFLVIVIDYFTKSWVIHHLTYQEPFKISSIFNLTLTFNTGSAFGFLHTASGWQNLFLGGIQLVVSIVIVFSLAKKSTHARWINTSLCLILGGAMGNFYDRILYGHVIDFLSFHCGEWFFAIFNIADSAICIGAFMLFLHMLSMRKEQLSLSKNS